MSSKKDASSVGYALFNDVAQRIVTGNKWQQRRNLRRNLNRIRGSRESCGRVLDFGCGTGLFACVFRKLTTHYVGYDIDSRLTRFASKGRPYAQFTADKQEVTESGPYDLIIANCCFHHIEDEILHEELLFIADMLKEDGELLVIDIVKQSEDKKNMFHRVYDHIEQGEHLRMEQHYKEEIEKVFRIESTSHERSHTLSIPNPIFYNELLILRCSKPDPD